ncbi:hypothetical protein E3T55_10485 [Cryobacterium frigoriphilum]|uniref:Uncharacterized protein n=1 Tax=Cryobacterium frigoriphilum TaxID=1259150 RepID=A0A4R9A0M3_9MICO|nr:hypothetical protein [Cryobacterium frigoriphilum]TFD49847.1 hypothetical protein E3T55_10485 [Cryobacterium frigoriphilum]
MKKVTIGLVTALLLSGLTYSPAFAESDSYPGTTSAELVNEEELQIALEDEGISLSDLEATADEISVETTSDLGSGEIVRSTTTLSLEDNNGLFSLTSENAAYSASYSMEIQEMSDSAVAFTMTDLETGESESYADDVGYASVVPVLVLGIPIALEVLKALVVSTGVVILAGVTWIAATSAIDALTKKGSTHQHFRALIFNGKLVLGSGMTLNSAVTWGRGGSNTWSRTQAGAQAVAKGVKNGLTPVGPERDAGGRGKFAHYHPSNRSPAMHAFFGMPN